MPSDSNENFPGGNRTLQERRFDPEKPGPIEPVLTGFCPAVSSYHSMPPLLEELADLEVLLSEAQIRAKIRDLAQTIRDETSENGIPLMVGVLKGSIHFLSDLSRELGIDHELDFIQVSSYHGGKSSSGVVQIRKDLDTNIEGRFVYLVEDIVDTGTTLAHLRELLGTRKPQALKVVALLSKLESRNIEVPVEHIGFEIPNEFVVGYGLDYGERFRNLPYIAILRDQG